MTKDLYPDSYFGATASKKDGTATREETLQHLSPYKKHLVSFIDSIPQNGSVLDIGCGSGRAIRIIKSLRPDLSIAGCDINDVSSFLPEWASFRVCGADEVIDNYPPNTFDAVLCQHTIEHLLTPMGLTESIKAVLKPGGRVFMETPNWTRLFIPFSHNFFWNDYTHLRPFSKYSLTKLFLEYSFSIETVITCTSSRWFNKRSVSSTKETIVTSSTAPKRGQYSWNSPATRLFARLVNPLIPDILIVVAKKEAL